MIMNNNQNKLIQCYSDVLSVLNDYTFELTQTKNDIEVENIMAIVEKLTTNLKRIGETQIIEIVEHDLEPKNDNTIEEKSVEGGEAE